MIKLSNLRYEVNNRLIIDNLSISIYTSEIVTFMGPSGSGKSTLLRLISGLNNPSLGTRKIFNEEITSILPNCSYNFQNYGSFPWFTVYQNLKILAKHQNIKDEFIFYILDKIGLREHMNKYPNQLSGGMKKRLALGRCFVSRPSFILLDESFSSLDIKTKFEMYDLLLEYHRDYKPTVIIVSHDIDEAIYLSDRIILSKRIPYTISEIMKVDIVRPRNRTQVLEEEFSSLSSKIKGALFM